MLSNPIFKESNRNSAANYRLASLTSQVSQIFERILKHSNVHFLEESYSSVNHISRPAMADKLCDCLRPKSPLCSCQHCQWFCVGQDAIANSYTPVNNKATEAPSAKYIGNTAYMVRSVSHGGGPRLANISQGRGRRPPTTVGVTKLE